MYICLIIALGVRGGRLFTSVADSRFTYTFVQKGIFPNQRKVMGDSGDGFTPLTEDSRISSTLVAIIR